MCEIWLSSASSDDEDKSKDIPGTDKAVPLWQLAYLILFWQSFYHVSNNAVNSLFKILSAFLKFIGSLVTSLNSTTKRLFFKFPKNIKAAEKLLNETLSSGFIEFVVCPRCHSIYRFDDCYITVCGQREVKLCPYIAFPKKRRQCGFPLLKKVKIKKGYKLIPMKVYPYQPLSNSLTHLFQKEGFAEACGIWRKRLPFVPQTHLLDIYDGQVWSNFSSFLRLPNSLLLTINTDWFQPYTRIEYSVGAIYLSIQNLLKTERYKDENILLVGLIPGPCEPKLNMNTYLRPLVDELCEAWIHGITIKVNGKNVNVRLAVSCVACDIPASRKLCGFLGHNAVLGCNKCLKEFTVVSRGILDYSGFDRENWVERNVHVHRSRCSEVLKTTSKTKMRKAESTNGVRYSDLSYFDPVRFTIVDDWM